MGTTLAALLYCLSPPASEKQILWTGATLQLPGIGAVVWSIGVTRSQFGHAPVWKAVRGWAGRFPLRKLKPGRMPAHVTLPMITVNTRFHVPHVTQPDARIEARVDALEKSITAVHERITSALMGVNDQDRKSIEELDTEAVTRAAEVERTRNMLETTATGGVHISAIGAVWLFFGVTLSTAAPELACWLK